MASISDDKHRHVIPNWRSFERTAKLGELGGAFKAQSNLSFRPDISDLLTDWEEMKTLGIAADIIGAAVVGGLTISEELKEICKYVLSRKDISSDSLVKAAKSVLGESNSITSVQLGLDDLNNANLKNNNFTLFKLISECKHTLKSNPTNAIAWVELARLYSIQGYDLKAERAMKNALFIAPENRYVLRSMARFFAHIGDLDFAHRHLSKATITKFDPWVLATEISIADLRGRNSRFAKNGMLKVKSDRFNPFSISELSSALATLELNNDSIRKSKKLFKTSLIQPNDNSLAQAEWASQVELKLDSIDPSKFIIENNYEALARDAKEKGDYVSAINHAKNWFVDIPYSKGAVLFGYDIALHKLKDYGLATDFGSLGLISHPHDAHLLNNLAYTLALDDRPSEALDMLSRIRPTSKSDRESTRICLIATNGLIKYRQGDPIEGKRLYEKAISQAKEASFDTLLNLAIANYAREEARIAESVDPSLIAQLKELKLKHLEEEVHEIIDEVIAISESK